MHIGYLERVLAVLKHIIVAFEPQCDGSQLWTREPSKRMNK